MKKSDIKPGMIVDLASGEAGLVVRVNIFSEEEEKVILTKNNTFRLDEFRDDLTHKADSDNNIDKVYSQKSLDLMGFSSIYYPKTLLWQRSVEMSMKELKQHFKTDLFIIDL